MDTPETSPVTFVTCLLTPKKGLRAAVEDGENRRTTPAQARASTSVVCCGSKMAERTCCAAGTSHLPDGATGALTKKFIPCCDVREQQGSETSFTNFTFSARTHAYQYILRFL